MVTTESETLSATEAADRLGVHHNTVLRWLAGGKLEGKRPGRAWEIPVTEVERVASGWEREMEEYGGAVDAARFLSRWLDRRRTEAERAVDAAVRAFIRAADDGRGPDLDRLGSAVDELRALRSLSAVEAQLRAEARDRGRRVDARLDAAVSSIKDRAHRLGFDMGDENE